MNPFTLLDSLLEDYASPRARRTIHTLILLISVLVTIWFTAGGDWREAVVALVAALYAGANKANTGTADEGPDHYDPEEGDPSAEDVDDGEPRTEADVDPFDHDIDGPLPTNHLHGG